MGALAIPLIVGVGSAVAGAGVASLLAPKAPKAAAAMAPPSAPSAPSAASQFGRSTFLGASEGSANGTFLTGSNSKPSLLGGGTKKTLLGQ